jgi:hypothetical protein
MFRRLSLVTFALLVWSVAAPAPSMAGGSRPFKGRVTAQWDNIFNALSAPPAHFEGGGPVTHMGNTTQAGTLMLVPKDARFFYGQGSVTITAANGDTVSFDYFGLLDSMTGEGPGTFTFTGGTGRFAGATGGGTFSALIDLSLPADQPMTVTLDGQISY